MSAAPPFTDKQGQYLAFIYAYSRIFRRPPFFDIIHCEQQQAITATTSLAFISSSMALNQLAPIASKLSPTA